MPNPRHAAVPMVGVFLAVAAMVLGTTAAVAWKVHHAPSPTAASTVSVHRTPALALSARPAPGSFSSRIPDTSLAAGSTALRTKPGTLVASGKGFRVERVDLARPSDVQVDGRSLTVHSVFRITITAGTWTPRDMPPVVSLDGKPLATGLESRDLSSLMAFTFDDAILAEGATVQVSYGLPGSTPATWTSKIEAVK